MAELSDWDSFYVIVGGSAGALIGLQFILLTLMAADPRSGFADANAAFGTPTVIYFSTTLFISAIVRAPWHAAWPLVIVIAGTGATGVAYTLLVLRRMTRQSAYAPGIEDWIFHVVLPLAAYALLAISGLALLKAPVEALFGVGAAALLLLFGGIHNSWDSVSYHVAHSPRRPLADKPDDPPKP